MNAETGTQERLSLKTTLAGIAGEAAVISAPDRLAFYASDVYAGGEIPALAVRPGNRNVVPELVKAVTGAGYAVVCRGGGMSYTGGYTATRPRTVLFDLGALNQIIDIDERDLVITVEAGVTWQQVHDALAPRGLRLPFFGTFSGARATVGGGLSNGALFMGTARHGTAAEIVVGMEVVGAGGQVITTGQAAFHRGRPAFRNYGPDLTGLFTHDAGALGVKTLASLRMMEAPAHADFFSFAFDHEGKAVEALQAIARSGGAEEVYLFDPATTRRSLEPGTLLRDLKRLKAVVGQERGWIKGLREGVGLVSSGRDFVDPDLYTLHGVCAGRSAPAVSTDLALCRERAEHHGGAAIAATVPRAARANPFEPVNGILGADGERWVALNAKVPHSDAAALIEVTQQAITPFRPAMDKLGVNMSFLYIAIGNHVFSYEPVLRWKDEWLPVHRETPEPAYLAGLTEPPPAPEARALVHDIRAAIVRCFAAFGAASNQIGKTYPHLAQLNPDSRAVLVSVKQSLDPKGLINPGALGNFRG